MTTVTIDIPDDLIFCLEQQSASVQDIIIKALEHYVKTESPDITQTRTWELCGSLEVTEPKAKYIIRN